jgi:peptidoglycan/LPS O-acetylase OafA/YrhL
MSHVIPGVLMNTQGVVPAALLTLAGLIAAFLGFRIRAHGDVHLIAGYDSQRVKNPTGLARFVGGVCFALSFAAFAVAVGLFTRRIALETLMIGFAAVVVAAIVLILVGRSRYERLPTTLRSKTGRDHDPAT